jgi:hypothetical protein
LVLLQALLAGLATAHAAALAADPFAAAICHGAGSADPGKGTAPDSGEADALCCAFWTAAGPALAPDHAPVSVRLSMARSPLAPALFQVGIVLDARAVRAGFSQAPPGRA